MVLGIAAGWAVGSAVAAKAAVAAETLPAPAAETQAAPAAETLPAPAAETLPAPAAEKLPDPVKDLPKDLPKALPRVGLGYEDRGSPDAALLRMPLVHESMTPDNPLYYRIVVAWSAVEVERGRYDWSAVEAEVDRFEKAGHAVVLDLAGGNPIYGMEPELFPVPDPAPAAQPGAAPTSGTGAGADTGAQAPRKSEKIAAWEAFVRDGATRFRSRVRFWQIGAAPNESARWGGMDSAHAYAYILKATAVLIRAEIPGAVIVSGPLAGVDADWIARLYGEGVAPYLDVVALRPEPNVPLGEACRALLEALGKAGAAPDLWIVSLTAGEPDAAEASVRGGADDANAAPSGEGDASGAPTPSGADDANAPPAGEGDEAGAPTPAGADNANPPSPGGGVASDASASGGAVLLTRALEGLGAGATVVFAALPFEARDATNAYPTGGELLVRVHSAIPPGAGRVPCEGRIAIENASGAPTEGIAPVCFYDAKEGVAAIALWRTGPPPANEATEANEAAEDVVHLTARRPGPPLLYAPVSGTQSQPAFEAETGGARGPVRIAAEPQLLLFREGIGPAPSGAEGTESLEVATARGITAEEVIAHYREFQAVQDQHLQHYRSEAMISYHFRLAGSHTSIDVAIGGTFYNDIASGSEWELRDYYLNGNKSRWKQFPEIPFIQPEKVLTLPLDLTFDRSYTYTYEGEATVDGRECHVLGFAPVDPSRSLYRGRVWIDKQIWARVRVSAVQTHVETPFLSNEETTTYAPAPAPDGTAVWLMSHIDGQQAYSAAGRSLIVEREVSFEPPMVNDPQFAEALASAHASDYRMLRDTDQGLRYLDRTPTGERQLKPDFDTDQFFALAGAIYDPSLKHVLPLAGANYFSYDFRKTGVQTNLFFAGLLAAWNVTKPNIGGKKLDLGGDLFLSALTHVDKDFVDGEEVSERSIERREQSISANLSRQFGDFVHLRTSYTLAYQAFGPGDDTAPDYTPPKDTLVHTLSLKSSFDRVGYEVHVEASYATRSNFEPWGSGADYNPDAKDYLRYELSFSKRFFLPKFQTLQFGLEGYDGDDLDRFSRYAFDRLDSRLHGFSGSGIRWDQGAIGRAAYGFNIADLFKIEVSVDQGRARALDATGDWTNHTGLGLSGNLLGPWKTIVQIEYGYALRSDVPAAKGDQELFLLILKLF